MDHLIASSSVLVVAHRLSTVRNASQVLVIGRGEICEAGTHDELYARSNSVYHKLIARQMTGLQSSASLQALAA